MLALSLANGPWANDFKRGETLKRIRTDDKYEQNQDSHSDIMLFLYL